MTYVLIVAAIIGIVISISYIWKEGKSGTPSKTPIFSLLLCAVIASVCTISLFTAPKEPEKSPLYGKYSYSALSSSTSPNLSKADSQTNNAQTTKVWVVEKGACYHKNSDCSNMKNPYCVTLEEAKADGRTACTKCY